MAIIDPGQNLCLLLDSPNVPGGARTYNLRLRRPTLCPIELRELSDPIYPLECCGVKFGRSAGGQLPRVSGLALGFPGELFLSLRGLCRLASLARMRVGTGAAGTFGWPDNDRTSRLQWGVSAAFFNLRGPGRWRGRVGRWRGRCVLVELWPRCWCLRGCR